MKIKPFILNGLMIYSIFALALILKNQFAPDFLRPYQSFLGFFEILILIFFNPLMIFVYDYLLNSKFQNSKTYHGFFALCFFIEISIWNWILPAGKNGHIILSKIGLILALAFTIQFIIAQNLKKYKIRNSYSIPALLIIPFFTYGMAGILNLFFIFLFAGYKP